MTPGCSRWYMAPFSFFTIHCWQKGFCWRIYCCTTPTFWAELCNFLSVRLKDIYVGFVTDIPRLALPCHSACIDAFTQQMVHSTLLSMLILIAVCIDKHKNNICLHSCCSQSIQHPRWLQVVMSSLNAVYLVRPLKVRYHIAAMFGRRKFGKVWIITNPPN